MGMAMWGDEWTCKACGQTKCWSSKHVCFKCGAVRSGAKPSKKRSNKATDGNAGKPAVSTEVAKLRAQVTQLKEMSSTVNVSEALAALELKLSEMTAKKHIPDCFIEVNDNRKLHQDRGKARRAEAAIADIRKEEEELAKKRADVQKRLDDINTRIKDTEANIEKVRTQPVKKGYEACHVSLSNAFAALGEDALPKVKDVSNKAIESLGKASKAAPTEGEVPSQVGSGDAGPSSSPMSVDPSILNEPVDAEERQAAVGEAERVLIGQGMEHGEAKRAAEALANAGAFPLSKRQKPTPIVPQ